MNNPYNNLQYRPAYSRVDELFSSNFPYPITWRDISQRIRDDVQMGYCPFLEWLLLYPDRANALNQHFRDGLTDACFQIYKCKLNCSIQDIVQYLHSALRKNLENARNSNYALLPMQHLTYEYYSSHSTDGKKENEDLRNQLQDMNTDLTAALSKLETEKERNNTLLNNYRQAIGEKNAAIQEKNDTIAHYEAMTEDFEKNKPLLVQEALKVKWEAYRAEREAELERKLNEEESRRIEEIRQQAEKEYNALVQKKLKNYLEEDHSEWNSFRDEVNAAYTEQSAALSMAKKEACDESARMQREMKKYMDDYMIAFCAKLDTWRNSVYDVEVKEFAQWYTSFCAFIDRLDTRIANELSEEAAETLQKITRNAKNLRRRLENTVLPKMGLRPFSPQKNDPFDSVYHVQKQSDDDYSEDIPDIEHDKLVIRCCVTPGVEKIMADRDMLNILVKAEVEAVTPEALATEDAERAMEKAERIMENPVPQTNTEQSDAVRTDNMPPVVHVTPTEEVHENAGELVDTTGL